MAVAEAAKIRMATITPVPESVEWEWRAEDMRLLAESDVGPRKVVQREAAQREAA
jgi:hypothetical protein